MHFNLGFVVMITGF